MGEPAEEETDEVSQKHLQSLGSIAGGFDKPFAIESYVAHPTLNYKVKYEICMILDFENLKCDIKRE